MSEEMISRKKHEQLIKLQEEFAKHRHWFGAFLGYSIGFVLILIPMFALTWSDSFDGYFHGVFFFVTLVGMVIGGAVGYHWARASALEQEIKQHVGEGSEEMSASSGPTKACDAG